VEENVSIDSTNETRSKGKWRINIPIFLFFLLLSAILWLLNSLNQEFTTSLHYNVTYINPPKNKVVTGEEKSGLNIILKGRGYTLLSIMVKGSQSPLIIDLESTYYHRSGQGGRVYYLSSGIRDVVQNQLGSDLQVISIQPDTVEFSLSGSMKKKVKVEAKLDISLEKQCLIKGNPICIPDSITVSGPSSIIDTLTIVTTQAETLNKLGKSIGLNLPLEKQEKLYYDNDMITVNIVVEKYTEAMLKVPIKVINLPYGLRLKTFPHDATLVFNVPLSDYNKLTPGLFSVVVNYREIGNKNVNKLDVIVKEVPEFVYSLKSSPKTVEFIVEK
jgi:hypothetical protein